MVTMPSVPILRQCPDLVAPYLFGPEGRRSETHESYFDLELTESDIKRRLEVIRSVLEIPQHDISRDGLAAKFQPSCR